MTEHTAGCRLVHWCSELQEDKDMKVTSFQVKVMIIMCIIILLPIVFGLIKWSALPDQMAIHFNLAGQADGWASKGFAVFGLPLIMLAIQGLLFVIFGCVNGKTVISNGIYTVIMALIPIATIVGSFFIYSNSLK